MATFIKLQNKGGVTYRAVIRRKGLQPITKVFKTKTAAKKWAQRVEGDSDLACALGDGRFRSKTAGDLIDAFLKQYDGKDRSRPKQLKWWKEQIGDRKLVELDSDLIQDQLDLLRSSPARQPLRGTESSDTERPRSPATINRFQSAISAVFQHAKTNRELRENPDRGIGRGSETHRFGRCLTEDETLDDGTVIEGERTRLLRACKQSEWDRLYLFVIMALSTGARLGELMSLTWDNLDVKRGIARLSETKNGSPGTCR